MSGKHARPTLLQSQGLLRRALGYNVRALRAQEADAQAKMPPSSTWLLRYASQPTAPERLFYFVSLLLCLLLNLYHLCKSV